MKSASLL